MRFSGKRGMEKETMVLLVIALVLLVLYFSFVKGVANASGRSADVTACRASVELNAKLHLGGIEFPGSLKCPARKLSITGTDNSKANQQLAEAMRDCWYQYGEGRLNIFSGEGTFCSVCNFAKIDTKEPVTGLPDFLLRTPMPNDREGRTYYTYLSGGFRTSEATTDLVGKVAGGRELLDAAVKHQLEPKKTYAVIFLYARGRNYAQKAMNQLTLKDTWSQAGLAGSVVLGASATVGVLSIGIVSGPVGWIALAAGGAFFLGGQLITYVTNPDNIPEWVSFTIVREWNSQDTATSVLDKELGCMYFPSRLE